MQTEEKVIEFSKTQTNFKPQMPTAQPEIIVRDLVKKFGDVQAVNGLNLEIYKGEMFGFLGPNGAGKTTILSMLYGLLAPTSGSAQIAGFDIRQKPQKVKKLIGVCPQEAAVFKFLTRLENLELFGNLHSMDKQALQERVTTLVQDADFAEAAKRKAKGYSGGMMRQLNLMIALMSDPEIVFLDEPTVGMDARARRRTEGSGQNLLILTVISLVIVVAGIQLFKRTTYR